MNNDIVITITTFKDDLKAEIRHVYTKELFDNVDDEILGAVVKQSFKELMRKVNG